MTDLIKSKGKISDETSSDIRSKMAKLDLQWWINKAKADPKVNHSVRVHFMKHRLERATGQQVKLKGF